MTGRWNCCCLHEWRVNSDLGCQLLHTASVSTAAVIKCLQLHLACVYTVIWHPPTVCPSVRVSLCLCVCISDLARLPLPLATMFRATMPPLTEVTVLQIARDHAGDSVSFSCKIVHTKESNFCTYYISYTGFTWQRVHKRHKSAKCHTGTAFKRSFFVYGHEMRMQLDHDVYSTV